MHVALPLVQWPYGSTTLFNWYIIQPHQLFHHTHTTFLQIFWSTSIHTRCLPCFVPFKALYTFSTDTLLSFSYSITGTFKIGTTHILASLWSTAFTKVSKDSAHLTQAASLFTKCPFTSFTVSSLPDLPMLTLLTFFQKIFLLCLKFSPIICPHC